ncbi:hypothetical protein Tco_0013637 [Tanacetum coccineum]
MENDKNVSQDITNQMNAEAEADQIISQRSTNLPTTTLRTSSNNPVELIKKFPPRTNKELGDNQEGNSCCKGLGKTCRYSGRAKDWESSYNCKEIRAMFKGMSATNTIKDAAYHKEKIYCVKQEEAVVQFECENKLLEYSFDTSGPIFDDDPMHKVQNNNDNYNVVLPWKRTPEQP